MTDEIKTADLNDANLDVIGNHELVNGVFELRALKWLDDELDSLDINQLNSTKNLDPVLSEAFRVLKKDGTLKLRIVHHRHDMFFDNPKNIQPVTLGFLASNERFKIVNVDYVLDPRVQGMIAADLPEDQKNKIINDLALSCNNIIQEFTVTLTAQK